MTQEEKDKLKREWLTSQIEETTKAIHASHINDDNTHLASMHKEHQSNTTQSISNNIKSSTDVDVASLQEERKRQYEQGNTGFVGGTGDNLLADNSGNFVEQASPFDVSQVTYDTRKEYASQLINQRQKFVNALGEENYYKILEQTGFTDKTPDVAADFQYAQLSLDSDLAWNKYLESGSLIDKQKAQDIDRQLDEFMAKNDYKVGNAPLFLSPNAQYLPQMGYYLSENVPAGIAAGAVGLVTAGGVFYVTKEPSTSLTWGGRAAKATYDIASLGTSFEATRKMTAGSLFKTLIDMGVNEDIAKQAAQSSAVQQALVETGSGAIQNAAEWVIATFVPGSSVVSKAGKAVLSSKGLDVLTESLEEYIQESQSIGAEKWALEQSGLDTSDYTAEYERRRRLESALGAVPITLGAGGVEGSITQALTTTIVDQKNINSIKSGYKQSINNLQQRNAELKEQLNNQELTGKQQYDLNRQIKDNDKQIEMLQVASSDENVKDTYESWKEFQKALSESQELRDSTKLVEAKYNNISDSVIERAQQAARASYGNNNIEIEVSPYITQAEQNIKSVLEKEFQGKNVVYYSTFGMDGMGDIHGFMEDNNTIYIEQGKSAKDLISAAYHEIGHIYAAEQPALYNAFKNKLETKFGNNLDTKLKEYNKQTGTFNLDDNATLTTRQRNSLIEELFGNELGIISSKAKNIRAIENKTLTALDRIKDIGKSLASSALGIETTNERISNYDFSSSGYLGESVLGDREFENMVMNTFKSLKPVDQVKEAAKTTEKITEKKAEPKTANSRIEQRYAELQEKNAKRPEIMKMIAEEKGLKYDPFNKNGGDNEVINQVLQDLKDDGKITETGTKFSKESSKDNMINNLRNELAKDEDKIKATEMWAKRTGRAPLVKKAENQKAKIKGYQIERQENKKSIRKLSSDVRTKERTIGTLSKAYQAERYGRQFAEKAKNSGLNFGKEYKQLFIELRRTGDSIEQAYELTKAIKEQSMVTDNAIKTSMNILNELRSNKIYNKIPNELKTKIDAYDKFWSKSGEQTNLTLAKRILNDATIRELIGNVAISNSVRKQLMDNDRGTINLKQALGGSVEVASQFAKGLEDLRQEVKVFQERDMDIERTKELQEEADDIKGEVSNELKIQSTQKTKEFKKNVFGSNDTTLRSQMTFKTETQAVMGGNINTKLMKLDDNLQKGEIRKKRAIVGMYDKLENFLRNSKGTNKLLGVKNWSKGLRESLSNKSDWIDTGIEALPRAPKSFIMSLAMHLKNDQNMTHISGGVIRVATDDNGETSITFKNGEGVRIPDENLYKRGKIDEAYDAGNTVKLSYDEAKKLVSMLNEEELAFVDAVKDVYEYTTKLTNEVSNRIYGYDLATVENYFPIHVWRVGASVDPSKNVRLGKNQNLDALSYLTNAGWLQERATSFAPIYLENIAQVLDRSMNNVATFYGYAEALRDNEILLNSIYDEPVRFGKGKQTSTLREALGHLSSSYLKDYNNMTRYIVGLDRNPDSRFRGLMAMNTLSFNIGTWLTQPMSFFNTIKYYNTADFLKGVNPINNNLKLNKMIRQYYEDLGFDTSNVNNYQLARSFISMATPNLDYRALGYKVPMLKGLYDPKLVDKLGVHGIEAFDNIAVTAAARMQAWVLSQDPNIEFGSEEYFEKLGADLTKMLVETQPEFSQINRANMFRTKNGLLRTLNLFGTPANQMFNNLAQSALELRYEQRQGDKQGIKEATRTLAKSISGVIISSALVGLVRALRDTIRSDDDDDDFKEKWLAQSIISLLSPTLILDDVAQFIMSHMNDGKGFGGISSYDFNSPETTFLNGITNLAEKMMQLSSDKYGPAKKIVDVIKALGVITPIDTKGVVRFVTALLKYTSPDIYRSYQLQGNKTAYNKWQSSGSDMATFYKAYEATRDDSLIKDYGYIKGSKSGTESAKKQAFERALRANLPESDVDKYMEILGGYKK